MSLLLDRDPTRVARVVYVDSGPTSAVPEPGPVVTGTVSLTNDARRDVPATIVCSSFPSAVMMQMAREGHPLMAEVATLRDLDLVDLPTGHWPMWSRPAELAATIAAAAASRPPSGRSGVQG